MLERKKIIIVEKHFIIGTHIIQILRQEGYEVYSEVVSTKDFLTVCNTFNPDIIIINKNLFYEKYDLFQVEINLPYPPRLIILYNMIPGEDPTFMLPDVEQVEKPFFSYEIRNILNSMT